MEDKNDLFLRAINKKENFKCSTWVSAVDAAGDDWMVWFASLNSQEHS